MTKTRYVEEDGAFIHYKTEHRQKNTVQHWQLRDLVASDGNLVYTVDNDRVVRLDLDTNEVEAVVSCHMAPTSMTVGGSHLVTGTDRGELAVYCLGQDVKRDQVRRIFQASVTPDGDVVNSLAVVSKPHGDSRLYASLNDHTVRCYSLPSMLPQQTLKHHVAVNYCAESPDGNSLVTVGDNDKVNHWTRDSSGQFVCTAELSSEARAEGMCCAWNQWGSCFASAHQCGHMVVWDSRLPPGQNVACHEVNQAVRTVKFSGAPVDLLAFAEHESAFHVVDSRKYRSRHTVRHVDNQSSGISGLAFLRGGARLAVGIQNRGVQEWDVDSVSRRCFSDYLAA